VSQGKADPEDPRWLAIPGRIWVCAGTGTPRGTTLGMGSRDITCDAGDGQYGIVGSKDMTCGAGDGRGGIVGILNSRVRGPPASDRSTVNERKDRVTVAGWSVESRGLTRRWIGNKTRSSAERRYIQARLRFPD
jgi:hypothetical protein